MCSRCLNKSINRRAPKPLWELAGYRKKMVCEVCGFRARYSAQMIVYYLDGKLTNVELKNLRSVCKNCEIAVAKSDLPWKSGDLEPDR